MQNEFQIKTLSKAELADAYGISRKTLIKWIHPIILKLENCGYQKTQKHFTYKQVKIIVKLLGNP